MKTNFVSVVTLGRFNPAILTPEFLAENCGFVSDAKPNGQTTPFLSIINYADLRFYCDPQRFEAKQDSASLSQVSALLKVTSAYLDVLRYTPLDRIGCNLNVSGGDPQNSTRDESAVLKKLSGFEAESIKLRSYSFRNTVQDDGSASLVAGDVWWEWERVGTLKLELSKSPEHDLQLNLNFEVAELTVRRSETEKFFLKCPDAMRLFNKILKSLGMN